MVAVHSKVDLAEPLVQMVVMLMETKLYQMISIPVQDKVQQEQIDIISQELVVVAVTTVETAVTVLAIFLHLIGMHVVSVAHHTMI